MKKYTERELWAFVNCAETHEQIQQAADYITGLEYLDVDTWGGLMDALAFKSRELYREARA